MTKLTEEQMAAIGTLCLPMTNGLEDIQKCKQYATWWEEFRRTGTITIPGAVK